MPQGGVQARATPDDFGAQIGQGLQHIGGALSDASDVANRVAQDQGRIWAYDAASTAYTNLKQHFSDVTNSLDPNDPDFTSKVGNLASDFEAQVNSVKSDLMDAAPTRSARRVVESHMTNYGHALINHGIAEQARITGDYTGKLVADGAKNDQDAIAADPSNENYDLVVGNRKENIGGLLSVSPELKMKWQDTVEHNLALTQVGVLAATKPKDFLATVNAQGGRVTIHGNVKGAVPGGPPDDSTGAAPTASVATSPSFKDQWNRLVKQESGGQQFDTSGNPLTSSAGAVGVSQMLPSTGPEAAKLAGLPWDETKFRQDPSYNEQLGQAYFQKQLDAFGGDFAKAAAAYNMGPNGAAKIISRYGDNWLTHAPGETQKYVAAVTAGFQGQQPEVKSALVAEQPDLPQVQSLTDQDIAEAKPAISGWGKLTWQEKVAAVRQAEAAVGGQLAMDRAQMERDLKDAQASLMSGKNYPGLDSPRFSQENITKLWGPVDGPRKFDQLQYVKQVGGFIGQMNTMPVGQAVSFLKNLEPQGGSEFADKNPVYQQALQGFSRLNDMRNKDYMQWATDNKVAGAQPLDFTTPDAFQKTLNARLAPAMAGVTDYQANAHLLTKDEAGQFGDMVSKLAPQDQIAYLKAMRQGTQNHDDWYRDTLAQIAPKNTMLAYSASVAMRNGEVTTEGGPQNGDMVGKYILEGTHILQGKDIDDPTHTGRPLALDDKMVRQYFWAKVGNNAFSSPDAQRSAQAANDTYQAVKNYLAADIYHRGQDPRAVTPAMVDNAITAVTGGVSKQNNGSSLFVPWGMDPKSFDKTFPLAVDAAVTDAGLKGSKLDAPDGYLYFNVDDGRYGILNANRQPLMGSNGRPVIVDMNRQSPAPYLTPTNGPSYALPSAIPPAQARSMNRGH